MNKAVSILLVSILFIFSPSTIILASDNQDSSYTESIEAPAAEEQSVSTPEGLDVQSTSEEYQNDLDINTVSGQNTSEFNTVSAQNTSDSNSGAGQNTSDTGTVSGQNTSDSTTASGKSISLFNSSAGQYLSNSNSDSRQAEEQTGSEYSAGQAGDSSQTASAVVSAESSVESVSEESDSENESYQSTSEEIDAANPSDEAADSANDQNADACAVSTGDYYIKVEDEKWYIYKSDGTLCKNATPMVDGYKYWCSADGTLCSGWLHLGKWKMYFDPETYKAAVFFTEINGKMYLFNKDGVMQDYAGTTEIVINGVKGKYWFSADDASLKTGWLTLGNMELYFDPETYAAYVDVVAQIDGKWYAFNSNGVLIKNATPVIDGSKYYCSSDGTLRSGWLYLGKWKMYFDPETYKAAVFFTEINGKMYLFNKDGVMQNYAGTTEVEINGVKGKYWFSTDDASLKTGWLSLGKCYLYFDPETYACLTNGTYEVDGRMLTFDSNGCVKNYVTVGSGKMYGSISEAVSALIKATPAIISSLVNDTIAYVDIYEGTYTEGVNLQTLAGAEGLSASGICFTGIGDVTWKSSEVYPTGCLCGFGAMTVDNINFSVSDTASKPAYAYHYEAGQTVFDVSNPGVLFKNCSFHSDDNSGVGVGMGMTYSRVTFDTCQFTGEIKDIYCHNSVFEGADNDILTFRNCTANKVYIFDAAKWGCDRTAKLLLTFIENKFNELILDCGTEGKYAGKKFSYIPEGYVNFEITDSYGNSNPAFDG